MQGRGFAVGLLPEGCPLRNHGHARRVSGRCRRPPTSTPSGHHRPVAEYERSPCPRQCCNGTSARYAPDPDNLLRPASGLLRPVHLCEIHVTRQCAAAHLPLAKMLVAVSVRLHAPTETPMQKKNKDKAKHWHDPCPPGGRPSLFGILSMLTGWAPEPSVTRATRTASESWTPP